jgi:hypothetical protein
MIQYKNQNIQCRTVNIIKNNKLENLIIESSKFVKVEHFRNYLGRDTKNTAFISINIEKAKDKLDNFLKEINTLISNEKNFKWKDISHQINYYDDDKNLCVEFDKNCIVKLVDENKYLDYVGFYKEYVKYNLLVKVSLYIDNIIYMGDDRRCKINIKCVKILVTRDGEKTHETDKEVNVNEDEVDVNSFDHR